MSFLVCAGVSGAAAITTDTTAQLTYQTEAWTQADAVAEPAPPADALAEPMQQADVVAWGRAGRQEEEG